MKIHLASAARRPIATTLLLCAALAPPAAAQTLQGRVTDQEDGQGVSTAIVRLLDRRGEPLRLVLADSAGRYRIEAPDPGEYHVSAERLGYETTRSPLLAVADPEGTYPVDIIMEKAPVGLEGFTVTADRIAELERGLRLEIGLNPRSLRVRPLMRPTIEEHLAKGHNVTDLVRWRNLPQITVRETTDGPCFQWRNRGCIDVYLNAFRVNPEFVPVLPLDGVETIVVLMPYESAQYESGAILLYTPGWVR